MSQTSLSCPFQVVVEELQELSTCAQTVSEIRRTVESLDFVEIDTPVLQKLGLDEFPCFCGAAGGAEARPFIMCHNSLGRNLYLRIATELHLKRMFVGGIEKVYEVGRIFRDEGISTRHNPEFTTIEMYEAYSDYHSMMNMAEEIVTRCALAVHGKLTIDYQLSLVETDLTVYFWGTKISLEQPWRRETMHNLVKEVTGIDFNEFGNDTEAAKVAAKEAVARTLGNGVDSDSIFSFETCLSVGHVVNEVFETTVEPTLMQPTFVLDYPIEISPLDKPHRSVAHDYISEILGLPLKLVHRARLKEQIKQHNDKKAIIDSERDSTQGKQNCKKYDDCSNEVTLDEDFLTALEYGMPPASGMREPVVGILTRHDFMPEHILGLHPFLLRSGWKRLLFRLPSLIKLFGCLNHTLFLMLKFYIIL
ncbi:hypothetical protein MRB53_022322 [Persea americana]|uniref:Uncharacterized protein n=1 Tax=Persea americana TaxID=3435 RepID=A0ACC2L6E4_PERAE|nr:hypothetical protein MRB53_022322 [Persea americana]